MNDPRKTRDDPEFSKVQQLEELHRALMAATDDPGSTDFDDNCERSVADNDEAASALELLALIKQARQFDAPGALSDAPAVALETWDELIADTQPVATGSADRKVDDVTVHRLGRFEIRHQLGRGGAGVVFLAHDPQLGRDVAVKVPRPEAIVTEEMRERFFREAQAAAALSHPNIVAVYDVGSTGLVCYIVSEYVDGIALDAWIKEHEGPVSPGLAARIVSELADAVQHAHKRGVLHRDLKPANVLVKESRVRSQEPGEKEKKETDRNTDSDSRILAPGFSPRITDFGLAKFTESAADQTQTGAVVGTPAYMAPEQAGGDKQLIGPATDVYGLGAILYELLTGRPPFLGDTVIDTIKAIETRDPKSPRETDPQIPRDLEAVCMKCLEKKPPARYESAFELQQDLERFIEKRPVLARPVTRLDRLRRWADRNRALAGAISTATVLLLVALSTAAAGWFLTAGSLRRESAAKQDAEDRYFIAKKTVDDYFTRVSENHLLDIPGLLPLKRELLELALEYYTGFVAENVQDENLTEEIEQSHFRVGQILGELGKPTEALEQMEMARALQEDQLRATPANNLLLGRYWQTLNEIAELLSALGRIEEALTTIDEAILGQEKLCQQNPADRVSSQLAEYLHQRGNLLKSVNRSAQAKQDYVRAVGIGELLVAGDTSDLAARRKLANGRGNLALLLRDTGEIPQAEQILDQNIVTYRELREKDPRSHLYIDDLQKTLHNRGGLFMMQRKPELAREFLEESRHLSDQLLLVYPDTADFLERSAIALGLLGACYAQVSPDRELACQQSAVAALTRLVELDPDAMESKFKLAIASMNLGIALSRENDMAIARTYFLDALDLFTEFSVMNKEHVMSKLAVGNSHSNLAQNYISDDQYELGLEQADLAIGVLSELHQTNPEDPRIASALPAAWVNRATALRKLSRYEDSVIAWREAIASTPPPQQAHRQIKLAGTLAQAHRIEESQELLGQHAGQANRPRDLYEVGRSYALLAAAILDTSPDSADAAENALRAVSFLEQARAKNYFRTPKQIEYLQTGPDLDALRSRDDFQALLDRAVSDYKDD